MAYLIDMHRLGLTLDDFKGAKQGNGIKKPTLAEAQAMGCVSVDDWKKQRDAARRQWKRSIQTPEEKEREKIVTAKYKAAAKLAKSLLPRRPRKPRKRKFDHVSEPKIVPALTSTTNTPIPPVVAPTLPQTNSILSATTPLVIMTHILPLPPLESPIRAPPSIDRDELAEIETFLRA